MELTTAFDFDTTIAPCSGSPTPGVAGGFQDTYISSWAPSTNYGQDYYIRVRSDGAMSGLVRPDVSHINSAAIVTRAKLWLYVYSSGGHPMTLKAFKVNAPWHESQATWAAATSSTTWAVAGCQGVPADHAASHAAAVSLSQTGVWIELDLKDVAQQWVADPSSNQGVVLKGEGSVAVQYSLLSTQYWDVSKRPQFEIAYFIP